VIQNVGSELSSISKDSHMYRVVLHTMSGYCFLPTWRVKTGKSGHKTVLDALVCAQRCKISDTRNIYKFRQLSELFKILKYDIAKTIYAICNIMSVAFYSNSK